MANPTEAATDAVSDEARRPLTLTSRESRLMNCMLEFRRTSRSPITPLPTSIDVIGWFASEMDVVRERVRASGALGSEIDFMLFAATMSLSTSR